MEGKHSRQEPRAILLFGAPCSGKTTFAEKFSKRFNMPHYNVEDLTKLHNLKRQHILLLVEQLTKTRSNFIVEGGVNTEAERNEIRAILKKTGYTPSLIWIQTDVATIKMRLKIRLKSEDKAKTEYDSKVKAMEAPSEAESVIVLSGKHTFETQLKHVLHQLI